MKTATSTANNQVQALVSSVTDGLQKLNAADDAHVSERATIAKRLATVEKELAEMKKLISQLASTTKSQQADPALAEIKAQQALILERLAAATAGFDFENFFSQVKNTAYVYSGQLSKFLQRWYTSILTNYPSALARSQEYFQAAVEQAQVHAVTVAFLTSDAQAQLTDLLKQQGVPQEYVQYGVLSILGLVALIAFLIVFSILKCVGRCVCSCCGCCRSKQSKKEKKAAKANGTQAAQ